MNREVLEEILEILQKINDLSILECAKIVKAQSPKITAKELSEILYNYSKKNNINISALDMGGVLLDKDIFPETKVDDLKAILLDCGYKKEDVELALRYLYPIYIKVKATEKWYDTGIKLGKNEMAIIKYISGTWTANLANGMCKADGDFRHKAKIGYTMPGENEGALIAKLEDEKNVFLVGLKKEIVGVNKNLYLCINDDLDKRYGAGLDDNKGELNLEIKINLC